MGINGSIRYIFYHPRSHYFIISMDWKKQINIDCFLLLVLLLAMVDSQRPSCTSVIASGWVQSTSWDNCYENEQGWAIGNQIGYFPRCPNGWYQTYWNCYNYNDNYNFNSQISYFRYTTYPNQWGPYIYHNQNWCYNYAGSSCYDSDCGGLSGSCYISNQYSGSYGDYCYYYNCDYGKTNRRTVQIWRPCDPLCSQCTVRMNRNYCQQCRYDNGQSHKWLSISGVVSYSVCESYCPDTSSNAYKGQFAVSTSSTQCTFCEAGCSSCAGQSDMCIRCVTNYYRWLNWTDNSGAYTNCYTYCPRRDDYTMRGQYIATGTTQQCSYCSALCSWCSDGNSDSKCFACVTGAYLQLNWTDSTTYICANSCPSRASKGLNNYYPGQYIALASHKTCTFCHYMCTSCADLSAGTVCYTCVRYYYLWQNWPDATYNHCDFYCPRRDDYLYQGQFINNTADGSCSWCDPLCAWCDNGTSTKCFSCVNNGSTKAYLQLNWTDSTTYICATTCPSRASKSLNNYYPGQYIALASNTNCTFCHYMCTSCKDFSDGTVCFSCVRNYYLWLNWTDAGYNSYQHCDFYCPRRDDYLKTGQFINNTSDGSCSWCDSKCSWCDNGTSTKCFSCVKTVAWLQLNWTDLISYSCATSCPRRTDNLYPGQYVAVTTDVNCTWCNATCSWCENFSDGDKCFTCITTAYLLVNKAQCMSSFPQDNGYCYPDYQCINTNCPTYLYFQLSQARTILSDYPWTSANASTWMTQTNVCYLCHVYCLECTDKYDTSCTKCSGSYFQWNQAAYNNRCSYYCNEGNYTQGGLLGQYVDPTSSVADRKCLKCAAGCKFCAYASAQCYICQDNYFLLDDKETCASTFNCKQCTNSSVVTDGCATSNKYCRINNCPAFFYFPLYMASTGGSGNTLVTNPRYDFFTNATAASVSNIINKYEGNTTARTLPSSQDSPTPNSTINYRALTNLCKLCDFRCMKCTGPSNFNCTLCVDNYFLWTNATVCESYCPTGQYQLNISASYPANATQCGNCDNKCIACIGFAGNCTSCVIFPASNYAYLYSYVLSNSTCMTSCPTSSSNLTAKGYYGSIGTMICYACPGTCSNCNIDYVVTNYVILQSIVCATDNYCSKGIQCTACLQGSSLVSGTCVSQTTCRLYSYYQMGNSSSTWSPTNCICLDGYYFSSYLTCSICDISCLTCSGAAASNCLTCYEGYSLSGTTCSQSQVVSQSPWVTTNALVATTTSLTNTYNIYASCGTYFTLFGYRNTPSTSNNFQYNTLTITNPNYYGIGFQMNVLFIDNWDTTAGLYFRLNSASAYPSYTYTYNTNGAIGEQQCGTNLFDYFLRINGKISISPTTTNTAHSIYISSNKEPVQNSSGFYYMFGIKNAVFTVLRCHTDCSRCTGPADSQCTICSNSTKKLVNGSCVCNSAANYFVTVGNAATCDVGCPACTYSYTTNSTSCYYRDYTTNTCVNPPLKNCSSPFTYGYPYQLTNGYGQCVQNCSDGTYSVPYLLKCTTDCSKFNLYFYNGSSTQGANMSSCVSACPNQLIANPYTMYCVTRCSTSYYLKLENRSTNPTCTNNCTTGYENDNTNQCVTSCPNNYYTQTQSNHNKCTQVCMGAFFGDNVTDSCVNFCPFPSLADPTTKLCVNTCPAGYFVQVTISNGNRTCVTQCESGQYLNPYYLNCSTNPKDCPIGTYADTHTNKCQYRCTTSGQVGQNSTQLCQTSCFTGYAYWAINMCVNICPSNISLFGYISGNTRICVASCNSSITGLYGDSQANQTCVQTCSATPQATFGDTGTNLCVKTCPVSNQYGDINHMYRQCVTVCSNFPTQTFSYYVTKLCVAVCPPGFYGDNYTTTSVGVCATGCPSPYYGNPITNLCVSQCPGGYFGSPLTNRPCVQVCSTGYYGNVNRVCVTDCGTGYWADPYTNRCYNVRTSCSNNTYADATKKLCVVGTNCTVGTYADPLTMGCNASCSNSSYFGDPSSNLCVTLCPFSPDYYSQAGKCTGTCIDGSFADWQANRTCVSKCSTSPIPLYGTATKRCVNSTQCYSLSLFGNNNSQLCSSCSGTLPYGDPISYQCVSKCQLTYYGDPIQNLCVLTCNFATKYYADNITGTCTLLCTLGTYGVNGTTPICQNNCPPNSYALDTFRVCVENCTSGYFGDPLTGKCYSSALSCSTGYYGNSVTNMCVLPAYCQIVSGNQYYADNTTKMCISKCTSPNYGLNTTWVCVANCPNPYYGESTTRLCLIVSGCAIYLSFADPQLNLCVSQCSTTPIFTYSQNSTYTCVVPASCPANMFAENISQSCVFYCPQNTTYFSYADSYKTRRCLAKCFDVYYGDRSSGTGVCTPSCPTNNYFRDNSTQLCVYVCPTANSTLGTPDTFGDNTTDYCVTQCPSSYFAQVQINRTCVLYCQAATWGNNISRTCINNPVTNCQPGTWADNFTNLCTPLCTVNSSNTQQLFYGQNITRLCLQKCPSPSFAYNVTRVCIDICPITIANSPGYFGDPGTSQNRLCLLKCLTTGLYRDIANSRTCTGTCTFNSTYKTYRDPTTWTCVASCPRYPEYLYAQGTSSANAQCASSCSTGYMYDANMSCIASCPGLLDPTTNRCVQQCPYNSNSNTYLYANMVSMICVAASACPVSTYASDDLLQCVSTCPNNTYINVNNCVAFCPHGYYINLNTQSCVEPSGCPSSYFANNQTLTCVAICTNGTFGDTLTRMCLTQCYGTNYADPLTGLCSSSCSTGLIKNSLTLTCVGNCSNGYFYNPLGPSSCTTTCTSPYFANTATSSCVTMCTANPMTFASTSPARACVTTCPSQTQWFDLVNRVCTDNCPTGTYKYSLNVSCVAFCPPPYYKLSTACVLNCSSSSWYSDETTRNCVPICPLGYFRDPTTFKCVLTCPLNPVMYYSSTSTKNCDTSCPSGSYADSVTGSCVSNCSTSPMTYAEPNLWKCVSMCPVAYFEFADPISQKCVTTCPNNTFADNRQRQCLSYCGNTFFADSLTNPPSCASSCTSSTFADPLLFKCVTSCSASYFTYSVNNTCLQFCPYGYFADRSTNSCQTQCQNANYQYADSLTHMCQSNCSNNQYSYKQTGLSYGVCLKYCPGGFFSDPTTMKCVDKCPNGYFGQTTNNTCSQSCPQSQFMDSVNNLCQVTCPSANLLFGQPFSRQCVTACNNTGYTFLFTDTLASLCATTCSGSQFADFATLRCVSSTGCTNGTVSDPYYKKCVSRCYNLTYAYSNTCWTACPLSTLYADEASQSCVVSNSCAIGTYADPSKQRCVFYCDISSGRYANAGTRKCQTGCTSPLFADNITRTCASVCSSVPLYFGVNISQICVMNCPSLSFGDPTVNLCVLKCSNGYFGYSLLNLCVTICPNGYFADNSTNMCVVTCPTSPVYYGDYFTRTCVFNCTQGLFADTSHNRECHLTCLSPLFSENSTHLCVTFCVTGFANPISRQCIANCSTGYYGFSLICYPSQCPSATPIVYADDSTNLCVTRCPNGTFGQPNSRKCVRICPVSSSMFADLVNSVCVYGCVNSTYADSSLRACVATCSAVPALFSFYIGSVCVANCTNGLYADNSTRSCSAGCPNGTYSDSTTYTCVSMCPSNPMMWGNNVTNNCVFNCPAAYDRYADNSSRTCVSYCPNNTFADPTTFTCKNTCPNNYFGINSTWRCQLNCPPNSYADTLIRLCVAQCSINPIFYGLPGNNTCVPICPSNYFGNPITQQCVQNVGNSSGCPSLYYADSTTQLCVQVCPMIFNLYAQPFSKACKTACISPYFADNSTMKCVTGCPSYPSYFADSSSQACVKLCANGTFADNSSRTCVSNCSNGTYAQNSTRRCVTACPNRPLSFRNPQTWQCVAQCPPSYFSDFVNLLCIASCSPSDSVSGSTFARNDTHECVKVCPNGTFAYTPTLTCVATCFNNTYADNYSRTCLSVCPRSPALYANNGTMTCLLACPNGTFAFDNTRQCVLSCPDISYFRQNSSRSCVQHCNYAQDTYADVYTGYCLTQCSVGYFSDPTTMFCVLMCPDQPPMFAQNISRTCMAVCPDNSFGDNSTRRCVASCPPGSLSLPQTHLCVFQCPSGYYAYQPTQFCLSECISPYYGDPSTRSCVLQCPQNQLLYADNATRSCVYTCPTGRYAYQWSYACLPSCPIVSAPYVQTYAADYDNTCVPQCSYPFFSYDPLYKCVAQCLNPYFNHLQSHHCKACPSSCLVCTSLTVCTSCVLNYYLQNGACLTSCSLIYYANPTTRTCVVSYECKPFFGINSTHSCASGCPSGQFPNTISYRCDACPPTCVSCTSLGNCLGCVTNSVSANNFCYGFCNISGISNGTNTTHKYFSQDNSTCVASCPSGTYSSIVYCLACGSACATCTGSASNCISCTNGQYVLNGSCLTSCPSGYKPNSTLNCAYCGSSCGSGLTYKTNVTSIGGQKSIFMNFNDDVTFNSNLYNIIKVTGSRRLLASSDVGYQIVVIDSTTVQIIFPPGSTQTNFNVKIVNPQNIISSSGQLPADLLAQIQMDVKNTYTTQSSSSSSYPLYFTFLAIVSVISFLYDLELMKFLQLIYIHYFVVMTLPPVFAKVFAGLRYSTLYYLPRIFNVPDAVLMPSVPDTVYNAVGDYNFLRNAGFAFTPLLIILIVWTVLKILSVPEINRFKSSRIWCTTLLQEKFKYAVLLQWVAIFIVNTVFFACLQLRDYTIYNNFTLASLVMAHICLFFFVFISLFVAYRVISFHYEHPTLSANLKKASDLILKSDEADQLVSTNIFLSQKKKIDIRSLYYPKINNENIFPFRCIYRYNLISLLCSNVLYLRAIVLSLIIALAKSSVMLQMGLAIPLNTLTLLYFIRARPYTFKFFKYRIKNYFAIFHEGCLILLEILMLVLGTMNQNGSSASEKQIFSNGIVSYLTAVCTLTFVYHIFATAVFIYRKIWLVFIESDYFRVNFPEKYAKYQAAKIKNKKLVKGIDPIAKEALKNLIKGYKKNKSKLRPTEEDKANPQLPVKYKITYFDRDASSQGSKVSLSKSEKKKMLKDIFNMSENIPEKQVDQYDEVQEESEVTEPAYEEYEEEIEINVKDLPRYVANAEELLKAKKADL